MRQSAPTIPLALGNTPRMQMSKMFSNTCEHFARRSYCGLVWEKGTSSRSLWHQMTHKMKKSSCRPTSLAARLNKLTYTLHNLSIYSFTFAKSMWYECKINVENHKKKIPFSLAYRTSSCIRQFNLCYWFLILYTISITSKLQPPSWHYFKALITWT